VLGFLVGKMSGLPCDEFLRKRMFGPLGMHDTDFFVPTDKASRPAQRCMRSADGKLAPLPGHDFLEPPAAPSGGSRLAFTAAECMRFCECLRRSGALGEVRVIGPKTLALMRANHLPSGRALGGVSIRLYSAALFKAVGFGLGFAMTTDVATSRVAGSVGEDFSGGHASTAFWIDPAEDISVVCLTQFMPSAPGRPSMDRCPNPRPAPSPSADIRSG